MTSPRLLGEVLATAFLDGPWSSAAMVIRAALAISGGPDLDGQKQGGASTDGEERPERWPRWSTLTPQALSGIVTRMLEAFPEHAPRDCFDDLVQALARDPGVRIACNRRDREGKRRRFKIRFTDGEPVEMRRVHAEWGLPTLHTTADVARWLGLEINDLAWFADWLGRTRHHPVAEDGEGGPCSHKLAHYTYRWIPKRSGRAGVVGWRLVEAPKRWLKDLQRRILRELIERIPLHAAAHGFTKKRSIVTHATQHSGRAAVLKLDLEDFFLSIPSARVLRVFRAVGYPQEVSRVLTGLCTTRAPALRAPALPEYPTASEIEAIHRARLRYRSRHLPQGAPTSPALANLCAYGLDVRLSAATRPLGATYTRYADDLAFSGDEPFARQALRFAAFAGGIALDEGFVVNHRKTKLMRRSVRQEVTGLVVNETASLPRPTYDRLKAVLHNCVRFGPENQNRDHRPDFKQHLEGMVAWVAHVQPTRGARLAALLEAIRW